MKSTLRFLSAIGLSLSASSPLLAQEWSYITRGEGFYISWWKLLLFWILFILWVKASAFVNSSGTRLNRTAKFGHLSANALFTLPFAACFALFVFVLPIPGIAGFLVSFFVLSIGYGVALWLYVMKHNDIVLVSEKVFTSEHIKHWFANLGKTAPSERALLLAYDQGVSIDFSATAGNDKAAQQAMMIASRQAPGYVDLKEVVATALERRAERLMLDYTSQGVGIRYEIDGLWQEGEMGDREILDPALESLKMLCSLDPADRRSKQKASFGLTYGGTKYKGVLNTQGTKTGERVVLNMEAPKKHLGSLASLGMRDKMAEQLLELLKTPGMVIISGMPQGGLTTTWTAALTATDRMLRDFISFEDVANPTPYVENIEIIKFDSAAGENSSSHLRAQILRQPDAMVVPEFTDGETVSLLSNEAANEGRLIVGGVRAKEAVEALLRVMMLKPENVKDFVRGVKAVLNVRLARRLCDTCKVGYAPPPQLLQQLGIPAGRIHELFREWQPNPEAENKKLPPGACEYCGMEGPSCSGLAYMGRVGIFELLIVDDKLRQALLKQPKLDVLRQVAKQSGHRSIKDEGVLTVARGVTSLNELQRILSQ
jgi:type II secretory ATPase GspE/PulE/Tfp pilus assembly ATPase PilB-like protein